MKAYSTRTMLSPPPEFVGFFVEHGWSKVNRMYGKRAAQRYYHMLGPDRLKAARKRHKMTAAKSVMAVG